MPSKVNDIYLPVFLNHKIFLTEEERYQIYEGYEVEAIGSLFQSSFHTKHTIRQKIEQSETYCKYKIDTQKKTDLLEVFPNFYKIHIPLDKISFNNENFFNNNYTFLEDILNIEDAGREFLSFDFKKTYKSKYNKIVFAHYVELKDISELEKTLLFADLTISES